MSENPDEIYGDGVLVNGTDITWLRAGGGGYSLATAEPFEVDE